MDGTERIILVSQIMHTLYDCSLLLKGQHKFSHRFSSIYAAAFNLCQYNIKIQRREPSLRKDKCHAFILISPIELCYYVEVQQGLLSKLSTLVPSRFL